MESKKIIHAEVAYATPLKQTLLSVEVNEGSTIEEVILQSGILTIHPEINLRTNKVGIFSKAKKLTDIVSAGDRVEIYRPLLIDPKEARRKRGK